MDFGAIDIVRRTRDCKTITSLTLMVSKSHLLNLNWAALNWEGNELMVCSDTVLIY